MNTAMNDHIAQFVKGSHILTASAVLVLLIAAIPASISFLDQSASPNRTSIVGSVSITSDDLAALSDHLSTLRAAVATLKTNDTTDTRIGTLEEKVEQLEATLRELKDESSDQPVAPAGPKDP
jgi:septal ring factor EnvC (AmiA/AmiB activator)